MSQRSATTKPAAATPSAPTLARVGVSTEDNSRVANDSNKDRPLPATTPLLLPIRSGRPDEPPPPLDFSRVVVNGVHHPGLRTSAPHILDADTARARLTRQLLTELAPAFGLDLSRLRITVTAAGGARIEARGASALQEEQTILLHPQRYRPQTEFGRYLLAHEAVHAAQRRIDAPQSPAAYTETLRIAAAEAEASTLGHDFAQRRSLRRPRVALRRTCAAAAIANLPEPSFEAIALQNRAGELARIRELLGGLWISDSDVERVMLILKSLPPSTASTLIAALDPDQRYDLVNNINAPHRSQFRAEVLICYGALKTEEIARFDEDLFDAMDLHGLNVGEAFVVAGVVAAMKRSVQRILRGGERGATITAIERFADDPDAQARRVSEAADALDSALKEENDLAETRAATRARRRTDKASGGGLASVVVSVKTVLDEWVVSDNDAMRALGMLVPYAHDMPAMRVIAEGLSTGEDAGEDEVARASGKDYLRELIGQVPADRLYNQDSNARRAFMQLLLARPAYRSFESVLELTGQVDVNVPFIGMIVNGIGGFFSYVDSEEAYMAYQLVSSMPARARKAIMEYDNGTRWSRITSGLSVSQREGDTTHFYQGGKDRDAILLQLLLDETWTQPGRLHGAVLQAVAAGHYDWVFAESRRRYLAGKGYPNAAVTEVAERMKLYNPEALDDTGVRVGREQPETRTLQGNGWWNEGNVGFINQKIIGGIDFIFSSKDVEVATAALGGTGLNLVEFQDITGGSFMGARFESFDKLGQPGAQAKREKQGVNFANVKWDRALGVLELNAENLAIATINYPMSDMTVRTGRIDLRNVSILLRYPTDENRNQLNVIDVNIGEATVEGLNLISADSMKTVNTLRLEGLRLLTRPGGKDMAQMAKPRDGLLVDGVGGFFANLFLWPIGGAAGVGAMKNIAGASSSGAAMGANLMKPSSGLDVQLSLRSLTLSGVTTSSGGYIDSIIVENLDLAGGGTVEAYLDALTNSAARLDTRLSHERRALSADSDPARRAAREQSIAQLGKQIEHARAEIAGVHSRQREVSALEEQQRALATGSPPKELSADQRRKLQQLKASLLGTVVDIGRLKIGGFEGSPVRDIDLSNLHGQGQSTSALLGMMTESDFLSRFIEGGNPIVKKARDPQAKFELDIGKVELPDLKLTGAIPKREDAQSDLDKFLRKMDPSRPEHVARKARLEQRLRDATDYAGLLARDPTALNAVQRARLLESRRQLMLYEEENAFRIRSLTMEGASLRFGEDGSVGLGADELHAVGLIDPSTGLKIDAVDARGFDIDVIGQRGLRGLKDDWRKNLRTAKLGASYLRIQGLEDPESGIGAQEIVVDGSGERRALDLSLDVKGGNATARIAASTLTVKGASVGFTVRLLQAARTRLQARDETALTVVQKKKRAALLANLDHFLGNLESIEAQIARYEQDLARATHANDPKAMEGATKALAIARESRKYWLTQIELGELTATDLDLAIGGLGDIADKNWTFAQAKDRGISIEAGKEGGALVGGIALKQLIVRPTGPGTINAENIALGPVYGSIVYSSSYIRIRDLGIPTIIVSGINYVSRDGVVWCDKPSTVSGLKVSALIQMAKKPDAKRDDDTYMSKVEVDEFHIDRIDGKGIGYENFNNGMRVVVDSGALKDITMHAVTFELSPDDLGETKMHEDTSRATKDKPTGLHVAALEDARVTATMAGGLTASGRIDASSLAVHFVESGGQEIDLASLTLSDGKVKKKSAELDVDVGAQIKGIHVSMLADGKIAGRAKDVSLTAKGAKGKHRFDIGIEHADTGEFGYDGKTLNFPALDVPSIRLNSLHLESVDLGLEVPAGSPAELIGLKADVGVEMNHEAKGDQPPVKRILIRALHANQLTTQGFTVTLPSKSLTITLPSGSSGLIGDITMKPGAEYPKAFVIDAEHDWNMYGSLGFKSGSLKKLGADLPKLWMQHADVTLDTFSMGFLGNKGNTIELAKATLENIEGSLAGSDFTVVKGLTRHAGNTPGLTVTGFKKNEKGDVTIEGIDLYGFRYTDSAKGLTIDLRRGQLPKRADGKPAFERRNDGAILIPELDIGDAYFKIDDILKMGGGAKAKSAIDYGPNWDFLDQLQGHINFDINVPDSDYEIRVPITNGRFNYKEVKSKALGGVKNLFVDFNAEGAKYGGAIPPRLVLSIAGSDPIWWDLGETEYVIASGGNIQIATFIKHQAKTPTPMPWHAPPKRSITALHYKNVDVDLRMPGNSRIDLGNAGHLLLADGKDGLPFRFQTTDMSGGNIRSLMLNLTAKVSEMKLKTDAKGGTLSTGAIDISSVGLTTLSFGADAVGLNTMDVPKTLEGTIETAKARDIRWTPPKEGKP